MVGPPSTEHRRYARQHRRRQVGQRELQPSSCRICYDGVRRRRPSLRLHGLTTHSLVQFGRHVPRKFAARDEQHSDFWPELRIGGERDHAKPLQSAAEALWWLPRAVYGLRAPRACDPPCARRVANINAAPAPTGRPDTVGLGNASHNVSMLEPTDRGVYSSMVRSARVALPNCVRVSVRRALRALEQRAESSLR